MTGFGPAPNGTFVTVTLVDSDGAVSVVSENTCDNIGGAGDQKGTLNGQCTVTFTSATAGTVTGNASVTFSVGGVSLTRDTDSTTAAIPCGGGLSSCGPAVKHFVAGSISWRKVDNANALQGGATFQVCKTDAFTLPFGPFVDPDPDQCFDVADNGTNDADKADGKFFVMGRSGAYTVKETVAPLGFEKDPDTVIVHLVPAGYIDMTPGVVIGHPDAVITEAFVNSRPIIKITGFGYTNAATGTPTAGVLNGTTTFSADLHNYGTATATLVTSGLVASIQSGTGTLTCNGDGAAPALSKAITGTIAGRRQSRSGHADVYVQRHVRRRGDQGCAERQLLAQRPDACRLRFAGDDHVHGSGRLATERRPGGGATHRGAPPRFYGESSSRRLIR